MNFRPSKAYMTWIFLLIIIIGFFLTGITPNKTGEILILVGSFNSKAILINHEYWRFITSLFLCQGGMGLVVTVLMIYYVGSVVEVKLGHLKYLLLFIISGVVGNLFNLLFSDSNLVTYGTGGPICGLFAFVLLAPLYLGKSEELQNLARTYIAFIILSFVFNYYGGTLISQIGGLLGGLIIMLIYYTFAKIKQNRKVLK